MFKRSMLIGLEVIVLTGALVIFGCAREKSKVLNIAHRGASGLAPENTIAAFRKALECGADYVEFDVQLSKDGMAVLLHDSTLDRTTDGRGVPRNYLANELLKLDAGSFFSAEFAGEPLPTLDETLQFIKGKMKADIEIKITAIEPGIAQKVIDVIRAQNFTRDCLITSFDRATVEEVKRLAPEFKTGFIINKSVNDQEFNGDWDYIVVKHTLVDEAYVKKAKKVNKEIYAYTVNEEEAMNRLIQLGIAGIITNYPNRLKTVLTLWEN